MAEETDHPRRQTSASAVPQIPKAAGARDQTWGKSERCGGRASFPVGSLYVHFLSLTHLKSRNTEPRCQLPRNAGEPTETDFASEVDKSSTETTLESGIACELR